MVELLVAWLPVLILLAVFGWYSRSMRKQYKQHIEEVNSVNQEIVDTNKAMIAVLEEIRDTMKKTD